MAASLSSVNNIDLNLTLAEEPIVIPNAQPEMPIVHLEVHAAHPEIPAYHPNELVVHPDIWQPTFVFDNRPITIHDSVMLNDSIAMAMAKGLVTPRDQRLLADRSDADAVNDSLAFSIQGAASVFDMARRLSVRNEEMKILRNQIGVLKRLLKNYKQKHVDLKQENNELKKLVVSYAEDMGIKVAEMEKTTARLQQQQNELQVNVHECRASFRQSSNQVPHFK
jgi:2C-methyl-D-erythritol 2,4-cyclodiphosphate synthase